MPKLSKRKRQLKEIHLRKNEDGTIDGDEGDENDEDEVEEPPPPARTTSQVSSGSGRSTKSSTRNNGSHLPPPPAPVSAEPVWVQCNTCDKWRSLPCTVDPSSLPDIWTCNLNIYDPTRATCDAAEENYNKEEDVHAPQKAFLRNWVRRLKCADRAENRLTASTRGKKRKTDVEWIRCSNPSCGKWRALTRNIDSSILLSKLHKNRQFNEGAAWYCSMNSWDESFASCSAPQEALWNCRWNLNG